MDRGIPGTWHIHIGNGCLTKHPFKNGCLGLGIYNLRLPNFVGIYSENPRKCGEKSFAKGPGPFIKGWPIPISTTDSCLFLPAIYCFKLGWFQTQRFYIKTQTYTQTTFPAKVVRKMMMPGYDRESKNDGRERFCERGIWVQWNGH